MPLETVSINMPYSSITAMPPSSTIKTWNKDDKTITVVERDNKIHFNVIHHGKEVAIPAFDVIGIPKGISLEGLKVFLVNTWIRLNPVGQEKYTLHINQRLQGGANIVKDPNQLWPDSIVPYQIDEKAFPPGNPQNKEIREAIEVWNNSGTGFQFVLRNGQKDYLVFGQEGNICHSNVGYLGNGAQYINCDLFLMDQKKHVYTKTSIIHEIGHAIGFYHEQQRFDRDEKVSLAIEGRTADYGKRPPENMFEEYDFLSIMHYPINAEFKDGQIIKPKNAVIKDPKTNKRIDFTKVGTEPILSLGDIAAAKFLNELRLQKDGDDRFKDKKYLESLSYYETLVQKNTASLYIYNQCGQCCFFLAPQYQNVKEWLEAAKAYFTKALELVNANDISNKNIILKNITVIEQKLKELHL